MFTHMSIVWIGNNSNREGGGSVILPAAKVFSRRRIQPRLLRAFYLCNILIMNDYLYDTVLEGLNLVLDDSEPLRQSRGCEGGFKSAHLNS
jgi:hypothetical protein